MSAQWPLGVSSGKIILQAVSIKKRSAERPWPLRALCVMLVIVSRRCSCFSFDSSNDLQGPFDWLGNGKPHMPLDRQYDIPRCYMRVRRRDKHGIVSFHSVNVFNAVWSLSTPTIISRRSMICCRCMALRIPCHGSGLRPTMPRV